MLSLKKNQKKSAKKKNKRSAKDREIEVEPEGSGLSDRFVLQNKSILKKEILATILLAIAVFMFLALKSYDASDPSWNTTSLNGQVQNQTGIFGAYVSDALVQTFGVCAFVLPISLLIMSLTFFTEKTLRLGFLRPFGILVMTMIASTMFRLHGENVTLFSKVYPSGGIVGELNQRWILFLFNRTGAYVVTIAAFVVTGIAVTHLSVGKSTQELIKFLFIGKKALFGLSKISFKALRKTAPSLLKLVNPIRKKTITESPHEEISDGKKGEDSISAHEIDRALAEVEYRQDLPKLKDDAGPKIITRKPEEKKSKTPKVQETLSFNQEQDSDRQYQLPNTDILKMKLEKPEPVDEWSLRMNSKILEKKLLDYGVEGKVVEIHPGPVITMYEFQPAPGVKVGKIVNLSDDLSLSMGGRSVRIIAPIPGKPVVGIEIPNHVREIVSQHEIVDHEKFLNDRGLTLALGKDTEGEPVVANLAKMPHLLVAGATGTGKSVAINAMICSMLLKSTPDEVRFLMVDPKMVELAIYEGIPQLLLPVITDPKKASVALKWAVNEMEQRLALLSKASTRNIDNFNKKAAENPDLLKANEDEENPEEEPKAILNRHGQLPYIVIIIDELADLMMISGREIEESITRLAQMARAVGIHLILATQRPSVDVITGLIKANFPARMSFKVSSRIDSRTILDASGAESLLGDGDMLFIPPGTAHIKRIHGAYVTETEVSKVVDFLKDQGKPHYEESILEDRDEEEGNDDLDEETDELFDQAVEVVASSGQASISYIQRRLRIGYNRAARIMEMMELKGIVGPQDGAKGREILVSSFEDR